MATNAQPGRNPADDDSMGGMLAVVLRKQLMSTDDMLPARVISFDRTANRATVQPCIHMVTTSDQLVPRAQLASVPVFRFGGGGMVLTCNLKPGDLGWIKASDRDISVFLQAMRDQAPNTARLHSFEDGMFFPDAMRSVVITGEDAENMTLQSLDGTQRVSIATDYVQLASGEQKLRVSNAGMDFTGGGHFIINGIDFNTHRHTGVTPGLGTSGGPTA